MLSRAISDWLRKARKARLLLPHLRHAVLRQALRRGVAAAVEHEAVLRSRPWATIVDVGANRGQFVVAAAVFAPSARMIAFEPLREARGTLEGLGLPPHRLVVRGTALGAKDGTATIHRTRADDSSSLLPPASLQHDLFGAAEVVGTEEVEVHRLDVALGNRALDRPALLKVDVQGTELDVLVGAEGVLDQFDRLLVECSFVELYTGQAKAGEVLAFLAQRGFELEVAYNLSARRAGDLVQADLVFAPAADTSGSDL